LNAIAQRLLAYLKPAGAQAARRSRIRQRHLRQRQVA
jgi:hypothetical protein